jgi:hypothetical protein
MTNPHTSYSQVSAWYERKFEHARRRNHARDRASLVLRPRRRHGVQDCRNDLGIVDRLGGHARNAAARGARIDVEMLGCVTKEGALNERRP